MAASKKPPALLVYLFLFSLNLLFFPSLCLSADVEHIESVFSKSLVPRELSAAAGASGTGDFSCGPTKPCSNKACCGKDGWCGFGDKYCGKGCQSHCDAKADCGVNAAKSGQTCPLNVCCSEFGFCGTTSEFCGKSCQSNCVQPKPKSSPTNVRKRVVGYWEAWNDQHACGKMSVGEIPVNYLTHLIVSFGYIDSNFRIANMDGLSSDVYRNVGEIKAQNPGLKIMIALGGWTFNDPGPWQSVFPTMVSSQANRATFIKNLLGFLSEYGYDGVDFDWEYPGAKDRGGSDKDGDNYTAMLKELRQAITASGRDYITTFTAPTSYWYLRHFDIKNMSESDGDNPIGKHVLSHTNLTEIDLALDLFWRTNVEPSKIVMGLGFYGRSFTLASSSCWKPGCAFTGPGAAGPCTNTAGILSYKEIKDIVRRTGATSYLDKQAACRYLVYDDNSWISYDDPSTIQAKIDYANKMGLSGVMIWAIDLDDSSLESLRAVSDPSLLDSVEGTFDLVDLDKLFPKEYLPASGGKPNYGLVTFGDGTDPTTSGFGFLLVAGDSHVVNTPRTARVTCVSGDLEGCYQIMERGVEGTVVEMPDSCASNQLVRAISLTASKNQSIPHAFSHHQRFSQVFDFTFDFNFKLMRRDSNNTSIRMDYSNAPGYWNQLVDRPGIQSRDLKHLDERFFAPTDLEWNSVYDDDDKYTFDPKSATTIKRDVSAPLYWQTVDNCDIDGSEYNEGFGAYVDGEIDAQFYYGFSLIGTERSGSWDARQSHGFLRVEGKSDMTFGFGGIGDVDVAKARKGNPAQDDTVGKVNLDGHIINAGHSGGLVSFQPYYKVTYSIGTFNGTDRDNTQSAASFNGRLNARVVSDFGKFQADFPWKGDHKDSDKFASKVKKTQFQLGDDNVLYGSSTDGGAITIGSQVVFGLNIEFILYKDLFKIRAGLPELALAYNTGSTFTFSPGKKGSDESCAKYEVSTDISQVASNGESIGWDSEMSQGYLVRETQGPKDGAQCFKNGGSSSSSNSKRVSSLLSSDRDFNKTLSDEEEFELNPLARRQAGRMPGWGLDTGQDLTKRMIGMDDQIGNRRPKFDCVDCERCNDEDEESDDFCCGCVSMKFKYGFSDIPPCDDCDFENYGLTWQQEVQLAIGPTKRDAADEDEADDSMDITPVHMLHSRKTGEATRSVKHVRVCSAVVGIAADTIWVNANGVKKQFRAGYQTEHVFEGQIIGRFFSEWLDKGFFKKQQPMPANPTPKAPCSWTDQWVKTPQKNPKWKLKIKGVDNTPVSFAQMLLSELGSEDHLDRLSLLQSRLNRKKGNLFTSSEPTDPNEYSKMDGDVQLQEAKELGLVFNYMNNKEIWAKFCVVYEAIYDHMGEFDTWYAAQTNTGGVTAPNLQKEWKEFNRELLDSIVRRSRASFKTMFDGRKWLTRSPQFVKMWFQNNWTNYRQIKFTNTCNNMDASKA
ncbi:glycoside hydrolase family 18 [Fusarium denticulatum]|uniref:chitinase n=1 Tax=Fusarium denticulatum TaxID=48507 RepID=A0A8H5TUD8_9HYPO|nr:glycoside hydrolase family 18 [Fusarium denticulatum]